MLETITEYGKSLVVTRDFVLFVIPYVEAAFLFVVFGIAGMFAKGQRLKGLLDRAEIIGREQVRLIRERMVDELKAEKGKLSKEEAKRVFDAAMGLWIDKAKTEGLDLVKTFGMKKMRIMLESYVGKEKNRAPVGE